MFIKILKVLLWKCYALNIVQSPFREMFDIELKAIHFSLLRLFKLLIRQYDMFEFKQINQYVIHFKHFDSTIQRKGYGEKLVFSYLASLMT